MKSLYKTLAYTMIYDIQDTCDATSMGIIPKYEIAWVLYDSLNIKRISIRTWKSEISFNIRNY